MKEEAMEIRNEEEESGEMKEKRKRKQESVSGPAATSKNCCGQFANHKEYIHHNLA